MESTWSMMPSMRCSDSVFMSRNSTPSTVSFVRCAMVSSGIVLLSAGSLHGACQAWSLHCKKCMRAILLCMVYPTLPNHLMRRACMPILMR